jgi:hypothetical protein
MGVQMRRRQVLVAAGASVATALAGCSAVELSPSRNAPGHPLADTTTTVRIDDRGTAEHDLETNAREALAYWEDHSQQYVGFDVAFEVVDDDPDVVIEYADDSEGCRHLDGYSERVLGCAPLLRENSRAPEPIMIRVVAGARPDGKIRITTQHEIGHVLGPEHDDEPREIMSNRPEDRIPLYDVRIEIWEAVLDAQERSATATQSFNEGTTAWRSENYGDGIEQFEDARRSFASARELIESARERSDVFEGHPQVETVDLDGLRARLERIHERMDIAVEFAGLMADASRAAADGNRRRANSHLRNANASIRAFNDVDAPAVREIAVALGLVRGLDRDGTVIDGDALRE